MPYIDPSVLASTIENAQCKAGELSDKYIDSVNSGEGCDCALAELRMLIFTIKALECCSSQGTCGTTIEETLRMMESTMLDCASPTCVSSVGSPVSPPLPPALINSLINVQEAGVNVGAFSTLNFIGAGITLVDVVNSGNNTASITISTDGIVKTWVADAVSNASSGLLKPGTLYWIVDAGDGEGGNGGVKPECSTNYYNIGAGFQAYPHNAGIILRAVTSSTFEADGIYLARVPKQSISFYRPNASVLAQGTARASFNQVFTANAGGANTLIDPADNPTGWTYQPRDNDTYYDLEIHGCTYDIGTSQLAYGFIKKRWDKRGNILYNHNSEKTSPRFNEFIKKSFRWGMPDIYGNEIHFWDDSTKRILADSKRSPIFNQHLINYSNVEIFFNNKIDSVIPPSADSGTRFFNVFGGPSFNFNTNVIDNSVYSNIAWKSFVQTHNKNRITKSVINNINFDTFSENVITQNSCIGDLYFSGVSNFESISILQDLNFSTVANRSIINNFGSKKWTSAGYGTSSSTSPNTINIGDTTFLAPGDIVDVTNFTQDVSVVGSIFQVQTTPTASSFTVLTYPLLQPASIPNTAGNDISIDCYYPSIQTSFDSFTDNNISNSVIRGINKTAAAGSFAYNNIEFSYFENYAQHTPLVSGVFLDKLYYSSIGNEYFNFFNNSIKYSVFTNNRIDQFSNNTIEYASFCNNTDVNNPGSVGLVGIFRDNKIIGSESKGSLFGYYFYSDVIFMNCDFAVASFFRENYVTQNNCFVNVTIGDGSSISESKFNGSQYELMSTDITIPTYVTTGEIGVGSNSYFARQSGLFNVELTNGALFTYNKFTGNKSSLRNLVLNSVGTDPKRIVQTNVPSYGGSRFLESIDVDGFILDGSGKTSTYNSPLPHLFTGNNNPVRGLTFSEGSPILFTAGTKTYQRCLYTFTATMQNPHLLNAAHINNATLNFYAEGITFNLVGSSGSGSPGASVNGTYYAGASGYFFTGTVTAITDDYTFSFTSDGSGAFLGRYLLHNNNSEAFDGSGNANPAISGVTSLRGVITNFDDAQGPNCSLYFGWWFQPDYGKVKGTVINSQNYSILKPESFDPMTRISLSISGTPPNVPSTGSDRKYQAFKDYASVTPTIRLYDPNTLRLPHFFDRMSCTILLGSANVATYVIDTILDMPDMLPVRFIASPGCTVQFNLVSISPAPLANKIIKDNPSVANYNITSRFMGVNNVVFDEIVLMKVGSYIKIISKIIHA